MLLPISVNLCCLDFNHEVSQNYPAVLLPISENLCCLDSEHWICCPMLKELLNEPPCVCIIHCILDRKVNRFSQEMFFAEETLPNLFSIHKTFFELWVPASLFVEDISIPCNSWETHCFLQNNLYYCYLIQFFDWSLK